MKLFVSVLMLCLGTITHAQLFDQFPVKGHVMDFETDRWNQIHLLEWVEDSTLIGEEWVENAILYSRYDGEVNWLESLILAENIDPELMQYYLPDERANDLLIDAENNVLVMLKIFEGFLYDGLTYDPNCDTCPDYFLAKISTAYNEVLFTQFLDIGSAGIDSRLPTIQLSKDGGLFFSARIWTGEHIVLQNGSYHYADSTQNILLSLDENLQLDTLLLSDTRYYNSNDIAIGSDRNGVKFSTGCLFPQLFYWDFLF